VDQITVALDRARHLLAEARRAVERVLDRLHGEVGVAAVNNLEDRLYTLPFGIFNALFSPVASMKISSHLGIGLYLKPLCFHTKTHHH
jgi:hypothetical protein